MESTSFLFTLTIWKVKRKAHGKREFKMAKNINPTKVRTTVSLSYRYWKLICEKHSTISETNDKIWYTFLRVSFLKYEILTGERKWAFLSHITTIMLMLAIILDFSLMLQNMASAFWIYIQDILVVIIHFSVQNWYIFKSSLGLDIIHSSTINTHSVRWVSIQRPPLKNTAPFFLPSPPLNLHTVQSPLFRQSPLYIGFPWTPLPNIYIYIYIYIYILKFFIFHPIFSFKSN